MNNRLSSSDSEAEYVANRHADPELTDRGVEGGILCGQRLAEIIAFIEQQEPSAEIKIKLLVSPMVRAIQSGDILASFVKQVNEILILPTIHEIGGLFSNKKEDIVSGLTRQEAQVFPRLNPNNRRDLPPRNASMLPEHTGWWNRTEETSQEAADRAGKFIKYLRNMNGCDYLFIICHGLFLDYMWKCLLDCPSKGTTKTAGFVTHNWGIGAITIAGGKTVTIHCINDAGHIPMNARLPQKMKNTHITLF